MFQGQNYINGKFTNDSGIRHFTAINPCTEEGYGVFPQTSPEDVAKAVAVAREAQPKWSCESRVKRADLFDNLAQLIKRDHDKLRDIISIETGKNLNESHAEVIEALHMCQVVAAAGRQPYGEVIASELPTKDTQIIRKPRGVVAVISPWNFPLAIGSFWTSAPAILEGNAVVHKPSELTPMVSQHVAGLYGEAGFPDGVYNLIHGDGYTGAALVKSDVDVILFTGSAEVGQEIRRHCAECHNKTYSIECGSKSAVIVFADGDMDLAVEASVASAFKLSGQRCVSSGRILVEMSALNDFAGKFVKRISDLKTGDPFQTDPPFYGPLISAEHRDRVLAFNQLSIADPETAVFLRGEKTGEKGYFLTPHVYMSPWDKCANKGFLKEEVFGPHVGIVPFQDIEQAIRFYNDTDYGLALGVITDDFRKHREIAQRCTAGMIYINGGSVAAESHVPFSSWKKSGYGSSAVATWKAVTHTTAITTNYEVGKISWAQGMK